jgi:hypothetical protein
MRRAEDGVEIGEAVLAYLYRTWLPKESRVVYGIFREFSCPLFRRFQKPEISRCYGSPFWGKNEFAKKVIHYQKLLAFVHPSVNTVC